MCGVVSGATGFCRRNADSGKGQARRRVAGNLKRNARKIKKFKKSVDKEGGIWYNIKVAREETPADRIGSIAQLGEHLPYKQRVIGSSPIVPTIYGPVVQLVRTLACHARGQGFESPSGRHFSQAVKSSPTGCRYASVAQSVERRTENPCVVGSIPTGGTMVARNSV